MPVNALIFIQSYKDFFNIYGHITTFYSLILSSEPHIHTKHTYCAQLF